MKNLNTLSNDEIQKEIINNISNFVEGSFYYVHKSILAITSNISDVNEEYCKNNNIKVLNAFNMGGTIVANKGDLDVAIFKNNGWDIGSKTLSELKNVLCKKGINVSIDKNDLLVDGKYKVASYATFNVGDRFKPLIYTVIHISLFPDVEVIKGVCTKPMLKIPKGLSDFGITLEEMVNFINNCESLKL